jgi:cytochrome P450
VQTSAKHPPGLPYSAPRATLKWLRDPAAFMDAAHERCGDVWTLRVGGTTIVMVSDPALVKGVLTADPAVLYGEATMVTPLLGAHSVLLLNEDEHLTERRLFLPFFQGEHVERYRAVMADICERELASWPLHEPIALLPRFEKLTVLVIMTAIFGVTGERQEVLRGRLNDLLAFRDKDPITVFRMRSSFHRGTPPPKSFTRVFEPVNALIFEEIVHARKDPRLEQRDDILAMLLQVRLDDGSPMTDEQIHDELMTLLIQGHTSTATALAWALERLVRHPEVIERLRVEAQTESEDYLDAVVQETLRVRSPQPLTMRRVVNQPYVLGEYVLEPDTKIACNAYTLHRREDLYSEPDRFRPERFLEQPPDRYTWIPFGGGARGCMGASLALGEMKVVLRALMQRARFAPAEDRDEKMKTRGVALSPSRGARVVIQERVPAGPMSTVA